MIDDLVKIYKILHSEKLKGYIFKAETSKSVKDFNAIDVDIIIIKGKNKGKVK